MKKHQWLAIAASIFLVGAPVIEAEAKRLGSGGNVGRVAPSSPGSSSVPGKPAQPQAAPQQPGQQAGAPAAASAPAAAAAKPATRSWMGPLAGIAAGLGLAALASYLGLGEELMSLMLIMLAVVAVVVIWRMLAARRRAPEGAYGQPAMARSGYGGHELGAEARPGNVAWPASSGAAGGVGGMGAAAVTAAPGAYAPSTAVEVSAEEIEVFIKAAREQFIRLQKVWDSGDIHSLAEFCSPEMTRELSHQIAGRRGASNETQVVNLDAEWLGMSEGRDDFSKPVDEVQIRFSGLIRESAEAPAADFDEVWTLQRVKGGDTGWVLAGITQVGG